MEVVLGQVSVDTFKILVWIGASIIGGLFVFGRRVSSGWEIASRMVSVLLAATISFVGLNMAIVFYILAHLADPRWSVGKDPMVDIPELSAGSFFEPVTNTLNDVLNKVSGSLNDAISIKNAFLIIPDFVVPAGQALWLLLALMIAARLISWKIGKMRAQEIERNTRDLADIRSQLGLSPFKEKMLL
ncbi:hypothetical protein [Arthrobacter sp. AFG20]|uniref:hypothetical protein n=1 Tax=Arthrobacter sp. AFG20 TaxID=1688671 RepID=UPI000C9E66BA|nr:hypothetical protein [Arthrobacter sp. AFG20]PNH86076.1 hypothetical protein CXZ05_02930 [Arthrobacter sp. AFG20]